MRDFGLAGYLACAGAVTRTDRDTLVLRVVDADAAILALRSTGGPYATDRAADTACKTRRLIVALARHRPVLTGQNVEVTVAAARAYARRRGYSLRLPANRLADLVRASAEGDLQHRHAEAFLAAALRPDPLVRAGRDTPTTLEGMRVSVSYGISDPASRVQDVRTRLVDALALELDLARARPLLPEVSRAVRLAGRAGGHPGPSPSSLGRVVEADLCIFVLEPHGFGVHVERVHANTLGKPTVDLMLEPLTSPNLCLVEVAKPVAVDTARPEETAARVVDRARAEAWRVQDYRAATEARDLADGTTHEYLACAWRAIDGGERAAVARKLGQTVALVEVALSSPSAMALLRRPGDLCMLLDVPRARRAPGERRLAPASRALLADAADAQGHRGSRALALVEGVERTLTATRARLSPLSEQDAGLLIADAARRAAARGPV